MATILEKANQILTEKQTKIKPETLLAGTSFFDVLGSVVELIGQEKSVIPTTEQQIIIPDEGFNGLTQVIVEAVEELDTSDATATAGDIALGKTAYVNGEKIEGTIEELTPEYDTILLMGDSVSLSESDSRIHIPYTWSEFDTLIRAETITTIWAKYEDIAAAIGLTADKIKSGETILGITGTYTGEEGTDVSVEATED